MKSKRLFHIALALILAVIIPMQAAFVAAGAVTNGSGPYRIVLRYYDPIQITYNIKYPVGDKRGEWKGPEDVPIGGVGTPGAGEFGINSYIATQIYCVDPFTPFHNRVPNGNFQPNGGAMADAVSGYVEAAPWNMSGAMQMYGDAVQWIAANGYRGIYGYSGGESQESKDSVERLNKMFGSKVGSIDKEIAVMATKVAIWKVIAGDSVQVLKTTLDGRPTKKATFDALVNELVAVAKDPILRAEVSIATNEINVTTFNVDIIYSSATYDDADVTYDYYGPMTVKATLKDTDSRPGAVVPPLDKVFLAISGPASDGVLFTTGKSATAINGGLTAKVYGTNDLTAQYFTGGSFDAGGEWTSDPFYMAVPKSRTNPPRGDELLIRAMVGTLNVPVREGTPVVFGFQPAGTDIQDWDAIQAFIGGASGEKNANLYAEDSLDTGDTSLGRLFISKRVENSALENFDDEFTFRVYYNNTGVFDTAKLLNLTNYPVQGAFSVNAGKNTFTLKNGGVASIQGLPMVVSGGGPGYEYYYWVEEEDPGQNYGKPHFEVETGKPAGLSADGNQSGSSRFGSFQLDDDENTKLAYVTVTNTYEHNTGSLVVKKNLNPNAGAWGVDGDTVFTARIKDVTGNNYVLFDLQPDGTYRANGNNNSPAPTNNLRELVRFSVNNPAKVTNLWSGRNYTVEEVAGNNYTAAYTGNGASFPSQGSAQITVTNNYEHGTGRLVVKKELDGSPGDWGVDRDTVFTAKVKDVTDVGSPNYLLFKTIPEADGSFRCVGNSVAGLSEPYTGPTTMEIKFTANDSAVISNVWAGHVYRVEENAGSNYAPAYTGNEASFPSNGNMVVVVTNDYAHGVDNLVITKKLAGFPEDWGVDRDTVFTAKVKDVTDDNYLLFKTTPEADGSFRCVGNNVAGLSEPYAGPTTMEIEFTANESAVISNVWIGPHVYKVEETGGSHYTATYDGNEVSFPESGNMIVDVFNAYEHGTGDLVIRKNLAGSPCDWNVDNTTVFTARVKDVTGNNYLLFERQQNGTYLAIGNNNSPTPTNDPRELVQFSAGSSAELKGLWPGRVYKVEETQGEHYTASYQGNGVSFPNSGNMVVIITNTYNKPDKPDKPCIPLIPFIPIVPIVPIVPIIPCIPGLDLSCITKPKAPETPHTPQPIVPAPKTGDSQLIAAVALVTGMVCFAGIVIMMAQRKKEEAALAGNAST